VIIKNNSIILLELVVVFAKLHFASRCVVVGVELPDGSWCSYRLAFRCFSLVLRSSK